MSDTFGIQVSMLVMVPVAVAAGLILASSSRFAAQDIQAVRINSVNRVAYTAATASGAGAP